MKPNPQKLNRKISKLETAVLVLFGLTLVVWIINNFADISWLLTLCLIGLFITSVALFISVLISLLQKRKAARAMPAKKTAKKKKRR